MTMIFFLDINFKMSTFVAILKFMTRTNDIAWCSKLENYLICILIFTLITLMSMKSFITSEPATPQVWKKIIKYIPTIDQSKSYELNGLELRSLIKSSTFPHQTDFVLKIWC